MKKIALSLLALTALTLTAQAQSAAYVTCADASVQAYDVLNVKDGTFTTDGKFVQLLTGSGATATYPLPFVSAMTFVQPAASQPQTIDEAFDVAFDAADDNAYTEVTEKITTTETATNDYGDFVENYDDDEESKGTITITYDGAAASYKGSVKNTTVSIKGADVTVVSSAKVDYVLKGATTDGSLTIYSAKKCKLTLEGVTIKNTDGAAINMPKKTKGTTEYGGKTVYVVLKDGTTNTLEDGTTYSSAVSGEGMKGTFFSEGQLIFSGRGTLNVKSNYGHGIASDDYIRVRGGNHCPVINITTSNSKDGISVNDYFLMYGGRVTIDAADDGISVGKGYADIAGGKLTVDAVDEGIVATNEEAAADVNASITVRGGLVKVTTSGDKGHAFKADATYTQTGGIVQAQVKGAGSKAINATGDATFSGGKVTALVNGLPIYDEEEMDVSSAAGLRSRGTLTLAGAEVAVKATADGGKGINNVGPVTLSAGSLTVVTLGNRYTENGKSSRARGVVSDGPLTVSGGMLRARAANDDALQTPSTLTLGGGALHAFAEGGMPVNAASFQHTAGWLVTK